MKIITEVGKTWQEVAFEPFSVRLTIEREIKGGEEKAFMEDAKNLQVTAEIIYNERRKKREKEEENFIENNMGRRRLRGSV